MSRVSRFAEHHENENEREKQKAIPINPTDEYESICLKELRIKSSELGLELEDLNSFIFSMITRQANEEGMSYNDYINFVREKIDGAEKKRGLTVEQFMLYVSLCLFNDDEESNVSLPEAVSIIHEADRKNIPIDQVVRDRKLYKSLYEGWVLEESEIKKKYQSFSLQQQFDDPNTGELFMQFLREGKSVLYAYEEVQKFRQYEGKYQKSKTPYSFLGKLLYYITFYVPQFFIIVTLKDKFNVKFDPVVLDSIIVGAIAVLSQFLHGFFCSKLSGENALKFGHIFSSFFIVQAILTFVALIVGNMLS